MIPLFSQLIALASGTALIGGAVLLFSGTIAGAWKDRKNDARSFFGLEPVSDEPEAEVGNEDPTAWWGEGTDLSMFKAEDSGTKTSK